MIELANGCICCTVADDFVPTMRKLLDRPDPPQHIVIETSGLAPAPAAGAGLQLAGDQVARDGGRVVTVVDAKALAEGRFADDEAPVQAQRDADPNLDHENPIEELFEDQLNCADMVIVNKTDLLETGEHDQVTGELKAKCAAARGWCPPAMAPSTSQPCWALRLRQRTTCRTASRITKWKARNSMTTTTSLPSSCRWPGGRPRSAAERIAATIASHDILRIKGFVDVAGSPARLLVQAVARASTATSTAAWQTDERRGTESW